MSKSYDRYLGLDCSITRRDFMNGAAMVIGASMLPGSKVFGATDFAELQNQKGYDPPVKTGLRGSHPGSLEIAHSLRDGTFWENAGKRHQRGKNNSECGWSIDPQNGRLLVCRVKPAVAPVALEPEAVTLLQQVTFDFIKPDFERAFKHVEEVFPLVHVRAVAAGSGWNSNQHGFEHLRAGRKQFHANAGFCFQAFAVARPKYSIRLNRQIIKLQYRGAVGRRQPVNGGDRRVRTRQFDGAEKPCGNVGLSRCLCDG